MRSVILSFLFFLIILLGASVAQAQPWNGKNCAVVLTYDDAIDGHLDHAVPALDSFGLKGTFYLIGNAGAVVNRIPEWRKAAADGHELGNHTGIHPCDGGPGRTFITPDTDLRNYTINRMRDEIRLTNALLRAIDGRTERTFAYPCGDKKIHDSLYYEPVKKDFIAARGVSDGLLKIDSVHLHDINCYSINGQSGEYMIGLVKKAQQSGRAVVFLFHGVGGGHDLNVSLTEHRKLLQYLKAHENEIWVAPMIDVAKYIKARKQDY
ncbi:MAG: polysaccharide deacetylase family protein [Chitinophagaceae bacterium]|nr:polysaccharide deacetylase family protein [Chitinophagaceae bacterium]